MSEFRSGAETQPQARFALTRMSPGDFDHWRHRLFELEDTEAPPVRALTLGNGGGFLRDPYLAEAGICGIYQHPALGHEFPAVLQLAHDEEDVVIHELPLDIEEREQIAV